MSDHANSGTSSEIWHEQQTQYIFLLKQIFLTHTKIFSHLVDDDGAELLLGVVVLELVLVQRGAGEQVVLVRRLPHLLVQEPDKILKKDFTSINILDNKRHLRCGPYSRSSLGKSTSDMSEGTRLWGGYYYYSC